MHDQTRYVRITTATTTVCKAAEGYLQSVIVGKGVVAATISIYDHASAGTNPILVITCKDDEPKFFPVGVRFANGLTVITSGATDLTVTLR